ncbi:MAG: erythromycin esterase family protein [Dokdonella sp.]
MLVSYRSLARTCACLLGLAALSQACATDLHVDPIDIGQPYREGDYAFLEAAVGSRSAVALGESIHVTQEMPLVRERVVRYLHERKGFDVLALEGSLIDAWTAQEHVYANGNPGVAAAQLYTREALFGLWQTAPMEAVITEALKPQSGAAPIYLTSFDLQPGMARAYGGSAEKSLGAFLAAVHALDPSVSDQKIREWTSSLSPSLECKSSQTDPQALSELEHWIDGSASTVVRARRPAMHAAALKLVPTMLRYRLQHCGEWLAAKKSMTVYQQSRDALNAKLALALLADFKKVIVWAHHSHLHYNSLGQAVPSMGQHLHQALGDQLYTIGLFALDGAAMDTSKVDAADGLAVVTAMAAKPLPDDARFSVEHALAGLSNSDFFVDLKAAPAAWAQPGFSRLETSGRMPTALSKDFDGAIFLHRVHGTPLDFLPPWLNLAIGTAGWIYQHIILAALIALLLVGGLARGVVRFLRGRRQKRRQ